MALEKTKKGYVQIQQNTSPVPGGAVERNGDYRVWLPAGKGWKVIVEADGEAIVVASGTASVADDKKFCLNVRTRVADRSDEPVEQPIEPEMG